MVVSHEVADGEKTSEGEREMKPKRYNRFVYFRDLFLFCPPYLQYIHGRDGSSTYKPGTLTPPYLVCNKRQRKLLNKSDKIRKLQKEISFTTERLPLIPKKNIDR